MQVIIGVDPHKASHTAVAISASEDELAHKKVRATRAQVDQLLAWAEPFPTRVWAVEGADGMGYLLAQQLVATGEHVINVPATLAARTRLLGTGRTNKNGPNDARSVAITALRTRDLRPVRAVGHSEVLRLLAKRNSDIGGLAVELLDDIRRLDAQLNASHKRIRAAIAASGTTVTDLFGIGPIIAAMLIGYSADVARFANRDRYAAYNGTAPVEFSSGGRSVHRLSQRGNRNLNHALHMAVICQLRHPGSNGRVYFDRRRAEGKTTKEALRSLKRHVSNAVYRHLVADADRSRH